MRSSYTDHRTIWTRPDGVPSIVPDYASLRAYAEKLGQDPHPRQPLWKRMCGRGA